LLVCIYVKNETDVQILTSNHLVYRGY